MPRMKNKARPDGRVQAKVYIGNGKYKYVYAANNRELEKKVQELKIKLGKGLDLTADRDTFGSWKNRFLRLKKAKVAHSWYLSLENSADKLSSFDNIPVSKLRKIDLEDLLSELANTVSESTGRKYTKKTLKSVKDVASGVMEMALENRVIEYNPFSKVQPPAGRRPDKRRALTPEEQQWIVDTPHRAQTAAMIMMYAGLRRGELIPLTWSDIDLESGTISVNKSVEMVNGISEEKNNGKTENAMRTIYIPNVLVEYLRKQPKTNLLVCPSAKGNMMSASAWERMWESYLCDLNIKYGDWKNCIETKGRRPSKYSSKQQRPMLIPHFTAHWLRHTFVTMMYLSGVDVETARQQAGHSDIQTTIKIYTHLDSQFKKKRIGRLDEYLNSNGCQMGVNEKEKCDNKAENW